MPSKDTETLVYWDSCVFLSYLNADDERADAIEALLAEATQGEWRIITSALTVAEVCFAAAEADASVLEPATLARIDDLWTPPAPVTLVEVDVELAQISRGIVRQALQIGVKRPKGADAIHLATAQRMGVSELHTYDVDLIPWGPRLGFVVKAPEPAQRFLPPNEPQPPSGQSRPAVQD